MKRFITYLYSYNGKIKGKNVGFIKVEINGENSEFLVQIKNLGRFSGQGNIYLVYESCLGIPIGEILVRNGEARNKYSVEPQNVSESGKTLEPVRGVRIQFEDSFLASCWTDNPDEVVANSLNVWVKEKEQSPYLHTAAIMTDNENDNIEDSVMEPEDNRLSDSDINTLPGNEDILSKDSSIPDNVNEPENKNINLNNGVQRIDISELRMLPTRNWYLVNNSFLTHGYANYKHLVIKTDSNGQKHLGVPGVSEPQERMMAHIFGFNKFEPEAAATAADVESGVFGYWVCPLEL